ncbi:unnamed protein product [Didymodactylos carnosus]|uniref:C2H2-type domain-containing protein n=1 Tax=Didymodactylos carnosus TaxID=1234261 RepID=A0A813QWQ5_9BILA|nr:unnamed protein product [Didymodactylos carnosus]CAF0772638.1 unnamed protein product [Didymodactylos carnosus]CAF3493197.1 unnamed protein product [Didymodactylos carnosus]CAF3554902.1 unnamed protein product [Didymodactylos carnosus]
MRYPCISFPLCLKTFDNGYVLRAHLLGCEHAQEKLQKEADVQLVEYSIKYNYDVTGIKTNKYYPTYATLDHSNKFYIKDKYQLSPVTDSQITHKTQRIRKAPDPALCHTQTKSISMDFSGYYT